MKKYVFYFVLINMCVVYAQKNITFWQSKDTKNNVLWFFMGKNMFADGTRLSAHILFQGRELPLSRKKCKIVKNTFIYQYGPITNYIHSGEYLFRMVYDKPLNSKNIAPVKTKTFTIGNNYQQYKQRKDNQLFFQNTIKEIKQFIEDIEKHTKFYLNQKTSKKLQMKSWLTSMYKKFAKLKKEVQKKSFPNVLSPLSPNSIEDLKGLLSLLNTTLLYHSQQLASYYKVVLKKKTKVKSLKSKKYIARLIKRISQRELSNVKIHKYLLKDITWFYDMDKRLLKKISLKNLQQLQVEIVDFSLAMKDYSGSSHTKETKEKLLIVAKKAEELLIFYTSMVQKNDKNVLNKMKKAKEEIGELLENISNIKQYPLKQKKLYIQAKQILDILTKLDIKSEQKKPLLKQLQLLEQKIQKFHLLSPNIKRNFQGVIYWLQVQIYLQDQSTLQKTNLKRYKTNIKLLLQKLALQLHQLENK